MGGPIQDALPDFALRYTNQQIQGLTSRVDVRYLANVIGDGIADDTDNLHNAFAKAASNGVEAVLGPGSYLIKGTVELVDQLSVWQSPQATIIGANPLVPSANGLFHCASALTFAWHGNKGKVTGQASVFFAVNGKNALIEDVVFTNLTGNNVDACAGFLNASTNSVIARCYADCSGVSGTGVFNAGFAIFGNNCGLDACTAVNGGTGTAIKIADCRNGWARDCVGKGCLYGAAFATDGVFPTNGCVGCILRGGYFQGNSADGIIVTAGSSQNIIDGPTSTGNTNYGCNLDGTGGGNMVNNMLNNLFLYGNTGGGLHDLGTTTQKGLIVTS